MTRSTDEGRRVTAAGALAAAWRWRRARSRATTARAERRPPYGMDADPAGDAGARGPSSAASRPLLEQMAPGQAELKYVDVRVNRPTALPAGASPGFEEMAPGAEFVAEKAEVSLVLDSKLPPPFRKDLKNLIKNRLEGLAVPVEIRESGDPLPDAAAAADDAAECRSAIRRCPRCSSRRPPQAPPTRAARGRATRAGRRPRRAAIPSGSRSCSACWRVLIGAFVGGAVRAAAPRRAGAKRAGGRPTRPGRRRRPPRRRRRSPARGAARAARGSRAARRVMGELLRENQVDKVAVAVELVGPSVVEDLRGDPTCAVPLREAAALLVEARPADRHEGDGQAAPPPHPQAPHGRRGGSGRAGVRVPARAVAGSGSPACSRRSRAAGAGGGVALRARPPALGLPGRTLARRARRRWPRALAAPQVAVEGAPARRGGDAAGARRRSGPPGRGRDRRHRSRRRADRGAPARRAGGDARGDAARRPGEGPRRAGGARSATSRSSACRTRC